jgi:WXG100 family type VII secretion target
MADVIRVDYEALTKIAGQFQNEAEAIELLLQAMRGSMTPLQNGGWIGRGSDAFFNEMESEVMPAVQRLADALQQAGAVSRQIGEVLQSAEEEAGSPFRASETGGGMSVPRDWLSNVGGAAAAAGSYNDWGIPKNWLDGVAGAMGVGSGSSKWGIPDNWLEGVTNSLSGGGTAGNGGSGGTESVGGSGGSSGGSGGTAGSPSEQQPMSSGGSGGGKTESPTDVRSPFGQQTGNTGSRTLFGGGQVTTEAEKGRLSYQSLNVGSAAPAANTPSPVVTGATGGTAPTSSEKSGSGTGIGLAVAALTPMLGIMGKTVKDLLSDD